MSLPSELAALLQGATVRAHASVSASMTGPIGETHLVAVANGLRVFSRESLVGQFEEFTLDPDHEPRLEQGDFADTLLLALADGSAHELNVSSFEREAVRRVLHPPPPAPEPEKLPAPAEEPAPIVSRAQEPGPDAEPAPKPVTRYDRSSEAGAEIIFGSNVGTTGCLVQVALLAGGVAALWFLHNLAIEQLGTMLGTQYTDEDFVFILTKIAAVIGGVYAGGRMSKVFGRFVRRLNWAGIIIFKGTRLAVMGQRGTFTRSFDTRLPIQVAVVAHTSMQQEQQSPAKRAYNLFATLEQDGNSVLLKATQFATEPQLDVEGLTIQTVTEKPAIAAASMDLNPDDLAKILRHVQR